MSALNLSDELKKHLNIQSFEYAASGGQKTVFKVKIEGELYALKIIQIDDERFKRELRISKEFDSCEGIPKIISIEKFEGETIILEEYIDGNDLDEVKTSYFGNGQAIVNIK